VFDEAWAFLVKQMGMELAMADLWALVWALHSEGSPESWQGKADQGNERESCE